MAMPFDEGNKGDPFSGEFPRRSGHERGDELEALEQRQVIELASRRYEPAVRHELLRVLERRRRPDADAGSGSGLPVVEFDYLPVEIGFDTLLVRGEILITAQSYEGRPGPGIGRGRDRSAKPYLDSLGMAASEVDCPELHGRVLRLTHPHMSPQELADIAEILRGRGFTASISNITPTAPVTKAIGGPLPGGSLGSFEPPAAPGTPVRVAVIDTGVAAMLRGDGWLNGVPRAADGANVDPLDVFPPPHGDGLLDLDAGHGTFVAGIVQQVAPGADIRVYRAVDSDGIGSEVTVACAMIRAVRDGADILNLSLGCQTPGDIPPLAIHEALRLIGEHQHEHDREVLVVAAAGNFGDTRPCWPAAFREVVSVAALAPDMLPSQWSSRGFWVTCSTIGQGLLSTYVDGRESPLCDPHPYTFTGDHPWAFWSGTSFAAPQVAAAIARLRGGYGYPLREALRTLLAAGYPMPEFGQAIKILPGM
jgi:subtilisin family serine protease